MNHFFVAPEQITDGYCRITGPDVNHIRNVLRMKPGERIGVRDGISRSYICELMEIGSEEISARIVKTDEVGSELAARIYLFQGLPKADKMELIIQKSVELGVHEIVPMETRRAVVRLDEKKAESRCRRWNAIAESAAKQCGRLMIPRVSPVCRFAEAVRRAAAMERALIPYECADDMARTRGLIASLRPGMQIGILIGPEGGFEKEEVEMAAEAGIVPVTLGRRILRTETAGLAALSILMFQLEQ